MSEIYEEKGTVTLVNGVGMFRYKIRNTTPSVSRKIGCAVTDPVNKSINMFVNPGDVAPPVTPETFKVSTKMEGEYIVYDVVSNLLYSNTSAPFNVKETSVDVKPIETFTISSVKSGNNAVFTVKSSDLASKTVVNVTMTEYRPGTPITVIKTNAVDVTLNNGVGTATHAISQTQPPVDQKVEGKLTNAPSVRTEVTVPRYVAPVGPPPGKMASHTIDLVSTGTMPRSGSLTVKITWADLSPKYGTLHVVVGFRGGAYNIYRGYVEHGGQERGSATISIPYVAPVGAFEINASLSLGAQTWPDGSSASGPGVKYTNPLTLAP